MKAHLLSNVTMQPLIKYLRPWPVSLGGYNGLIPELIDKASIAASREVTHVLCIFDSDALFGDTLYDLGEPDQARIYLEALESFCLAHPEKTVISNTFCCSTARILNFAEVIADRSVRARESSLNASLIEIGRSRPNLLLVDIEPLFRRYGEELLLSSAFWYSGRVRYTNLMFRRLGAALQQSLLAYEHQAHKVLILDLDNTLWGGVVGDTGAAQIELSEEGRGASFRDFQRALKALKDTGVLLAICSKNNPADVDEVFDSNSMMILKKDDFACVRANWESKPENIANIAEVLNLGVESFVFIDDNPVEREIVAAALPQIAIPRFPDRIETLSRWFVDDVVRPYFGKYRITVEDVQKTRQYKANELRQSLAATFDLDKFIEQLNIVYTLHVDDPRSIVRASQMTQKTNQFNLTTLRCDVGEITRYVQSPEHALIVLEYEDRFGSEGNVALIMLDLADQRITNFLMSCRVIGRNVERRLAEAAVEVARRYGLPSITGEFVPSPKNAQVATLYESLGFALLEQMPDGRKLYERIIE